MGEPLQRYEAFCARLLRLVAIHLEKEAVQGDRRHGRHHQRNKYACICDHRMDYSDTQRQMLSQGNDKK